MIKKGSKVKFRLDPSHKWKRGTVVGESRNKKCWGIEIISKNNKPYRETYHKDFVSLESEAES